MAYNYTGSYTTLGSGRGWLNAPAAASQFRMDRALGHPQQITEAGRTWAEQNAHYQNYLRYGSPIALSPDAPSLHQMGNAKDTNERPIALHNDHGWYQTVYRWINGSYTLVEPWHFEYFYERDNHRGESGGSTPEEEEDDMSTVLYLYTPTNALLLVDHMNRTIRSLEDNAWARDHYSNKPYIKVNDESWASLTYGYAYINRPNLGANAMDVWRSTAATGTTLPADGKPVMITKHQDDADTNSLVRRLFNLVSEKPTDPKS